MRITIDGRPCECEQGEVILDIAKRNGITIPTLCNHPAVTAQGRCRVCIVEVVQRGRSRVVASCMFPVSAGCEVMTDSDRVKRERAMILSLLLARAPESETVQEIAHEQGARSFERFTGADTTKCVLCGLCVQACDALGSGAIAMVSRGTGKRVATPYDEASPECIGCAACANICPTGNIEYEQTRDTRTIWNRTFDLVRCRKCGETIGTSETIMHAALLAGTEPQVLCESCREKDTAKALHEAWPFKHPSHHGA